MQGAWSKKNIYKKTNYVQKRRESKNSGMESTHESPSSRLICYCFANSSIQDLLWSLIKVIDCGFKDLVICFIGRKEFLIRVFI